MTGPAAASLTAFPPVLAATSRVLVLGTMPGVRSLEAGQYYAHPRNAFWRMMEDIFGISSALPYAQRLPGLTASGVALWDVLATCERQGSLDANIVNAVPNDFGPVLRQLPLSAILFNGRKAADLWERHVRLRPPGVDLRTLPSSSPANARLTYDRRLEAWAEAFRAHGLPAGGAA